MENSKKQQAIAALDAAVAVEFAGSKRFEKAQQFIQSCLANTSSYGDLKLPFAGPHFFCSFTFFENNQTAESPFPPATIFLPRWQVSCCQNSCLLVANITIDPQVNLDWIWESFRSQLQIITQSSRKIFLIPEQKAEPTPSPSQEGNRRQNPPLTPPRRGNGGRGQEAEPTLNLSQEGNRRQKVEIKDELLAEHDITPDNPSMLLNGRGHLPVQSEASFKSSVISALKSIQTHQLSKIVLANAIDVVSPRQFKLVNSLDSLRHNYPDCYIFSISNGKGQNFIGASPECLVSIQNRQLVTDAIAGSAPRGKTAAEDADLAQRLLCSEKERREHRFVLDFIIKCLSELGLNPQVELTNQLLQLSNIQHLWTPIKAQLLKDIHPLEIVAKLHPTPAVAGVPTKMAQEQILALETFDRSLYAAPLGWVDYQGNCEFIVGIRSALIESTQPLSESWQTCRARLYAGAGIVAGSDPNKELAEIQLKFQALLKTLL
ncbi:MAG: isochorismate synthase [Symploca sp. SIO1B1]|nr:isochorismate synthase [Symploca sp. SIO1B1]